MTKFRLKMDLSQFYDDERNLAYILVDTAWEKVDRLQQHVEELFNVQRVHFLTDDGVYIPSRESIDVIRRTDVLRAIIPEKIRKKRRSRSLSYDGFGDEAVTQNYVEDRGPKHNYNDQRFTSSTSTHQSNNEQRASGDGTTSDSYAAPTNSDVHNAKELLEQQCSHTVRQLRPLPRQTIAETVKTRKRKRNRKKKQSLDNDKNKGIRHSPEPHSSQTLKRSRKSVHFEFNPTLEAQNSEIVVFRCQLNKNGMLEPPEIELEEIDEEDAPPLKKFKSLIHEDVLIMTKNLYDEQEDYVNSCILEEIETLQLPEEQEIVNETTATEYSNEVPSTSICVKELLPLSESLVSMPNVGDLVLFKMNQLSETNPTRVTDYICGRCEEVDPAKTAISCIVLDGFDQIDKDVLNETSNRIQLFLDELLEKRVFRMYN